MNGHSNAINGTHNIARDNLIQFNDLPEEDQHYLKHIELTKWTPKVFGLDRWTRMFSIPDHLMRRIYRDDAWIDSDNPKANTSEKLNKYQRRILYRWLMFESPFSHLYEAKQRGKRVRTDIPECTDLVQILRKPVEDLSEKYCDDRCRSPDLILDPPANNRGTGRRIKLEALNGHEIQPESVIVKKAISKMDHLSAEEEAKYQSLLRDKEYLRFLDEHIEIYLRNNGLID